MRQTYYRTLAEIENLTRNLSIHGKNYPCFHCGGTTEWISHGFIYKNVGQKKVPIGKRIFCSNRNGHCGCGRTQRILSSLWSARIQVAVERICLFLLALKTTSVSNAYRKITHSNSPRQAWRWLNKLKARMSDFKTVLCNQKGRFEKSMLTDECSQKRTPLLQTFLSMETAYPQEHENPLSWFQVQSQQAVMG